MHPQSISIEDYHYDLPDHKIAFEPIQPKDEARLLVYKNSEITESKFYALADYLPENSVVIGNNSKVIPARIFYQFANESKPIELFLLSPIEPLNYHDILEKKITSCRWKCFVGNARKWKDDELNFSIKNGALMVRKVNQDEDAYIIEFTWSIPTPFIEILEELGKIPLPPYIKRSSNLQDATDYQTLLAQNVGSVAAPTAGLHFTKRVMADLVTKNIQLDSITLHVGAGTFKPVKSETMLGHTMHSEHFLLDKKTIEKLSKSRKIVLVGTTTLRTLESAYWIGYKLMNQLSFEQPHHITQWEVYNFLKEDLPSCQEVFKFLLSYVGDQSALQGSTQIIIAPSYKIKTADILITNFHQPKSTLLLLVSACIGDHWKKVYEYALQNNFRFLSYGDSSLLEINK